MFNRLVGFDQIHSVEIPHLFVDVVKVLNTFLMFIDSHITSSIDPLTQNLNRRSEQNPIYWYLDPINIYTPCNIKVVPVILKCIGVRQLIYVLYLLHELFYMFIIRLLHWSLYTLEVSFLCYKGTCSAFACTIVTDYAYICGNLFGFAVHDIKYYN